MNKNRILVTGGLGYIGSHTVVGLIDSGYEPIIVDNLSNSSEKAHSRLEKLTNSKVVFEKLDIRDHEKIRELINHYKPHSVIHFAALKSIPQSIKNPLDYYDNNVSGTVSLLKAMQKEGVKRIIFSSSAVVYGNIDKPATEDMSIGEISNPYGFTKFLGERILIDLANSDPSWSVTILRYFNPVGAHSSGLIGESPRSIPDNLMPFVSGVALGKLKELKVYGNDYPTPDGTGIRDYIHVVDLANGHIAALNKNDHGLFIYNLGTGKGHSVKELISTFEKVIGKKIPYTFVDRRPGDMPNVIADPTKAHSELKWQTKYNLLDMCRDEWNWKFNNPHGY